ncbi:MAG: cation transporter [Bacteroidales bacterium]|nr:cation transporter [Bacteroidales bacterium]HPJ06301.1 cation diffusion facilitator family transporter [Bacteroidales bacterium]HPQ64985.1 cation diffusion facilitator family transporter [Bacteroidales bacterium]
MTTRLKTRTARLSVLSNSLLIIMKIMVGIFTGSVSIISEAIHSAIDLVAAVIAFFAVKISGTPADDRHPFGHGKVENVSGVIEALLIFAAAAWIVYEAMDRFIHPGETEALGLGVLVMVISAVVNIFVSRRLYKVARLTDSVALEADALHLKTDVITSAGVALGLALIWITGWHILDPLIALLVALVIIYESWMLLRRAFFPLLDTALSQSEMEKLTAILDEMKVEYHDLRARAAGHQRFVEFHLDVQGQETIETIHRKCDLIEQRLESEFRDISVIIHPEPTR